MSGAWTSFKRAFGATPRRDLKAGSAVAEVAVQASVRTQLGDSVSGGALTGVHGRLQTDLQNAQAKGDTNAGYRDLGAVKTGARGAIPEAVDAKRIAGLKNTIPAFIKSAQRAIDMVDSAKTRAGYQNRLDALDADFQALPETPSKAELDKLQAALEKLMKQAGNSAYPGGGFNKDNRKDLEERGYKDALEARYGFKVDSPATSCQRLLKVLDILPQEHIAHDSLTSIKVADNASIGVGDYSPSGKKIRIDMAAVKQKPKFEYIVDGKPTKVDTFTVATLHEVGHSVDDKAGIMANPAAANYGGWNEGLTVDQVASDFWDELENTLGATHKNTILPEIKNALENKTWSQPVGVSNGDWATAVETLIMLQKLAADTKPWRTTRSIGDRVYHKTAKGWLSYSLAARQSQLVRDYQWNAPAEWFAELYAISWLTKKKPPSAIAPAAAEFMYRGKQ